MSPTTTLAPTAEPSFLRGSTNTSSSTSTGLSETIFIVIIAIALFAVTALATLWYVYLKRKTDQNDTKKSLHGEADQFNSNFTVTKTLRRLTNHFSIRRSSANTSGSGVNVIDEEPRLGTSNILSSTASKKLFRVSNRPNELGYSDTINFGTVVDNLEGENFNGSNKDSKGSAAVESCSSCRSDMGLITSTTDVDALPKLSEAHRSFYSFMTTFTRSSFAVLPSSTSKPTVLPPAPKYPPPSPSKHSNKPLSPTTQSSLTSSATQSEKRFIGVPRVKLTPASQYASPIHSARSPRSPADNIKDASGIKLISPTSPELAIAVNLSPSTANQQKNSTSSSFKFTGAPSRPTSSNPNPTSSVTTLSNNSPNPKPLGATLSTTNALSNVDASTKPRSPRNKFDESFDLYKSYNYSYTDPKVSSQSEPKRSHVMMQQSPMTPSMKTKTRTISNETTTTESSGRSYASSTNSNAPGSQSPNKSLNLGSNQSSVSYAPSPTPSQILSSIKPRHRTLSTEPAEASYNSQVSPTSSQKALPLQSPLTPFKLPQIQSFINVSVNDKVRSPSSSPRQSNSPRIPPRARKEEIEKGFYDFKA